MKPRDTLIARRRTTWTQRVLIVLGVTGGLAAGYMRWSVGRTATERDLEPFKPSRTQVKYLNVICEPVREHEGLARLSWTEERPQGWTRVQLAHEIPVEDCIEERAKAYIAGAR